MFINQGAKLCFNVELGSLGRILDRLLALDQFLEQLESRLKVCPDQALGLLDLTKKQLESLDDEGLGLCGAGKVVSIKLSPDNTEFLIDSSRLENPSSIGGTGSKLSTKLADRFETANKTKVESIDSALAFNNRKLLSIPAVIVGCRIRRNVLGIISNTALVRDQPSDLSRESRRLKAGDQVVLLEVEGLDDLPDLGAGFLEVFFLGLGILAQGPIEDLHNTLHVLLEQVVNIIAHLFDGREIGLFLKTVLSQLAKLDIENPLEKLGSKLIGAFLVALFLLKLEAIYCWCLCGRVFRLLGGQQGPRGEKA